MELKTSRLQKEHHILLPRSHHRNLSNGNRGSRDYHTLGDRLAQRIPRATTPPHNRKTVLHARGRWLSNTVLPATGTRHRRPLPAYPSLGSASLPTVTALKRPPAFPGPWQESAQPGPHPGRAPRSAPSPFGRTRPLRGAGRGAGTSLPHPRPWAREESGRSPGSGGCSLALGQRSPAGASGGSAGCGAGWRSAEKGEGVGMPGAASFLLRHRGSYSQAGRPRTLAHFLTASRSLWLALTPLPHTLVPTRTHARPLLAPSVARRARARATPLTHSARDAGGGRPALPQSEAPRAEPGRAPRPRPPDATARPTRGGGWWGEGLRQPAGPRRVALTSATGPAL